MKLQTNADYANEFHLLCLAADRASDDAEQAAQGGNQCLANRYRQALKNLRHDRDRFEELYWAKILQAENHGEVNYGQPKPRTND